MADILLVDDDDDSREAVAQYFRKYGYPVRAARNGLEALLAVATTVPHVVILDAMMPEMGGLEFLEVIRSYLRWRTIPVILLTGFEAGEHIERARRLGVGCVMLKASYRLADLHECVRMLLVDGDARCGGGAA